MKNPTYALLALGLFCCLSFVPKETCSGEVPNMGYLNTLIHKAQQAEDLNLVRYHAYKALNVIEISKEHLADCECYFAVTHIEETYSQLKLAAHSETHPEALAFLETAQEQTQEGNIALAEHKNHRSKYDAIRLPVSTKVEAPEKHLSSDALRAKVDQALIRFEHAIQDVIDNVPCSESKQYVGAIITNSEEKLTTPKLSEAKRYYHQRTLTILKKALKQLPAQCH